MTPGEGTGARRIQSEAYGAARPAWRSRRWMLGILLIALGLRGIAWIRFDPVAFDSAVYFEMADLLRAGQWSQALGYAYPPLYPILIAGTQVLGASAETGGFLIALAASLLILYLLPAITRITVGEPAAWAAAFLWAVHPQAVLLGAQALSDTPTVLCCALALWMGMRALMERRMAWALGAGVASGLAYLFRPEGIEPALALAALYFLATPSTLAPEQGSSAPGPDTRPLPRRTCPRVLRRTTWVIAPLVGWAIASTPYIIHLSIEAGSLTFSKKKSTASILRSLMPPQGKEKWPQQFSTDSRLALPASGQPSASSQGSPRSRLARLARNAYIFQKPLVNGVNPLILACGLIGVWGMRSRWETDGRARALLAGLLGMHLAVLLGVAANQGAAYLGRHHFFLMVLYALPFAAAGLDRTLTWFRNRLGNPERISASALTGIVVCTGLWLLARHSDQGVAVRPAAAWIQTQVASTPVIITNLAKLTYHAGAERVELRGTYEDILQRGRARSAHFLAFYPSLLPDVAADFLMRLDPTDLELVRVFPEPSRPGHEQRLEIYRLRSRTTGRATDSPASVEAGGRGASPGKNRPQDEPRR